MTLSNEHAAPTGGLAAPLLYRLAAGIPGFIGAAYVVWQGSRDLSLAGSIRATTEAGDDGAQMAIAALTDSGRSTVLFGLLIAVVVIAVVLPRRLPFWLGVLVAVPGFALLLFAWHTDQVWWPGVIFPPIAAATRLAWQARHP